MSNQPHLLPDGEPARFAVVWHGRNDAIGGTGHIFDTPDEAAAVAIAGARAIDFWEWADQRPFDIDMDDPGETNCTSAEVIADPRHPDAAALSFTAWTAEITDPAAWTD